MTATTSGTCCTPSLVGVPIVNRGPQGPQGMPGPQGPTGQPGVVTSSQLWYWNQYGPTNFDEAPATTGAFSIPYAATTPNYSVQVTPSFNASAGQQIQITHFLQVRFQPTSALEVCRILTSLWLHPNDASGDIGQDNTGSSALCYSGFTNPNNFLYSEASYQAVWTLSSDFSGYIYIRPSLTAPGGSTLSTVVMCAAFIHRVALVNP